MPAESALITCVIAIILAVAAVNTMIGVVDYWCRNGVATADMSKRDDCCFVQSNNAFPHGNHEHQVARLFVRST